MCGQRQWTFSISWMPDAASSQGYLSRQLAQPFAQYGRYFGRRSGPVGMDAFSSSVSSWRIASSAEEAASSFDELPMPPIW
jgi:hypothetical protein